jgi:putative membrane protein
LLAELPAGTDEIFQRESMDLSSNVNSWFLQVIAMLLTIFLIPGLRLSGLKGALLMVAALAAVNAFLWDSALFFQIPDSFTLHAALLFLCNGFIFWLLVKLLPDIQVEGLLPALIAPVVFTACSLAVTTYGAQVDWQKTAEVGAQWTVELFATMKALVR